jgi:predicted RNA-binding Zn-ribbon protein involved in translation (DUF1610 family)
MKQEHTHTEMVVGRDGVWISNGLTADFRHLYSHPNYDGIHRVQTASGEHYAHDSELVWDCLSSLHPDGSARPSKCPQCGDPIIQTNLGGGKTDDYCENCGWPDENRA